MRQPILAVRSIQLTQRKPKTKTGYVPYRATATSELRERRATGRYPDSLPDSLFTQPVTNSAPLHAPC